jgi:hypothetical protein
MSNENITPSELNPSLPPAGERGLISRSLIIQISVALAVTVATILYAIFFTSQQQSDIPSTYNTATRKKDINDTMTALLGTNWVAVVFVFYIISILLLLCMYALNSCSQIDLTLSDPDYSKYTVWGIYIIIVLTSLYQLIQASWYYVNDYGFSEDTLQFEREYKQEDRIEFISTVGLMVLIIIVVIVSSILMYNYIQNRKK